MSRFSQFLRQSLLHFLLIGAAVIALYGATKESAPAESVAEIVISDETVAQLAANFQTVLRRPPTPAELENQVDELIKEEILARETIALSLDRNDPIIRQRLRRKMETLTASPAAALEPSDEQLHAYFDAAPGRSVASRPIGSSNASLRSETASGDRLLRMV